MLLWRHALEAYLQEVLGRDLDLTWTANRRVMISFRHRRGVPVLRLHESFALADEPLKRDLAKYLTQRGGRVPLSVRRFINDTSHEREQAPPKGKLTHRGKNYDLRKIYRKLNNEYFGGTLKGRITWGRRVFAPGKKSIVFGSYFSDAHLIRIHPLLDTELVPLFFLECVVHHEMVHEFMDKADGEKDNLRVHSRRFKELERRFRYHHLALAWEKSHLVKLLKYEPPSITK